MIALGADAGLHKTMVRCSTSDKYRLHVPLHRWDLLGSIDLYVASKP